MKKSDGFCIFFPMGLKEMKRLGWEQCDIIIVTGDAYIDHPSFGAALIGRIWEKQGFKVGIISQPQKDDDYFRLKSPKLFFAVTSGNMDSMVCHYTSLRKLRSDDAYSPGGKNGFRPDYATIKYSQNLKRLFKNIPIVLGGIEASLRRLAHYDFWSDKIKHSIILDSKADLLIYGMGEKAARETALRLKNRENLSGVKGTAIVDTKFTEENYPGSVRLPSYEELKKRPECLLDQTKLYLKKHLKATIVQKSENRTVVLFPPQPFLSREEMDEVYDLPFSYAPHPSYKTKVPAFDMINGSVTISRGCGGGCSFCAISLHQGKRIQSRSKESILKEIKKISGKRDFKGIVKDLGGPTANLFQVEYKDDSLCLKCEKESCLYPKLCPNMIIDEKKLIGLYRSVRRMNQVRKVFVSSGIRYDIIQSDEYLEELVRYHVGGQLKVAPEHGERKILDLMNKPGVEVFLEFIKKFEKISKKYNLNQYVVPYLIAAFPGCELNDMRKLKGVFVKYHFLPTQVQIFLPTPMTMATAMFVAEKSPKGEKIYIEKKERYKKMQKEEITGRTYNKKRRKK